MRSQIFVLLIIVSLPLSGCLGDSIGSDPEIISNSVVVNEDEYVYIEFSCSDICDVEISFDQDYGPLMDMYTMTSLNYQDFQSCDEFYYIVPDKCTECMGFHEEPQCAAVCPVDCCIPDEDNIESEETLLSKQRFMHPEN